mgnify:CR=1 FL=1
MKRASISGVQPHAMGIEQDQLGPRGLGIERLQIGWQGRPAGDQADAFIVPAQLDGKIALFLVERSAAGVTTRGYVTQDGSRAAEVQLANAPATLITTDGLAALELAVDTGIAALCAEAVGVMDKAVALKDIAELRIYRGTCKLGLHDLPGATTEFKDAVTKEPNNALAHYSLGNALAAAAREAGVAFSDVGVVARMSALDIGGMPCGADAGRSGPGRSTSPPFPPGPFSTPTGTNGWPWSWRLLVCLACSLASGSRCVA